MDQKTTQQSSSQAGLRRAHEPGGSVHWRQSQQPASSSKTFNLDLKIPLSDNVRLIKYDFEKYGKAAERRRLLDRWTKEVEALPK